MTMCQEISSLKPSEGTHLYCMVLTALVAEQLNKIGT